MYFGRTTDTCTECGEDYAFFGVFDGSIDDFTSRYCSLHLVDYITKTSEFKEGNIVGALRAGCDNALYNLKNLIKDDSASSAVCAFVTRDRIYTANLGDSRAVLCRGGAPVMITEPNTRKFEEYADGASPDIYVQDREGAEFMVLASDGVWECASVEQVCGLVRHYLTVTRNMDKICRAVIDHCKWSGKTNKSMSAVVVAFEAAPEVSAESAQRDAEFEEQLRRRIAEIVKEEEYHNRFKIVDDRRTEERVMSLLKNLRAPDGSSIGSKRSFVKTVLSNTLLL